MQEYCRKRKKKGGRRRGLGESPRGEGGEVVASFEIARRRKKGLEGGRTSMLCSARTAREMRPVASEPTRT